MRKINWHLGIAAGESEQVNLKKWNLFFPNKNVEPLATWRKGTIIARYKVILHLSFWIFFLGVGLVR